MKRGQPIFIAIERNEGEIFVRYARIYGTEAMAAVDYRFVERYVKFLLWSIGGFWVYICSCSHIAQMLRKAHSLKGKGF